MARRRWIIPLAALGGVLLYRGLRKGSFQALADGFESFSVPAARLYDRSCSWPLQRFYTRLARDAIATVPSGRALDVGCGPGRLAVILAREAPGLTVTGLDISPGMIEVARRRAEAAGLAGRVHFDVGDVAAMPYPDERFDLVVSTFSLHHWKDPQRGLAEIRRVLKPGGQACIYDLADWALKATHHGVGLSRILASSPLERGPIDAVWKIGPVPLVVRYCLRRAKEPAETEGGGE